MADMIADAPALLALWDREKNTEDPAAVPAQNYRAFWWKCANGHSFQRAPRMLLRQPACPTCGIASTSLAAVGPSAVTQPGAPRRHSSPDASRARKPRPGSSST